MKRLDPPLTTDFDVDAAARAVAAGPVAAGPDAAGTDPTGTAPPGPRGQDAPPVVLLSAGAHVSGAEVVLLEVAGELLRRGRRVVVACPRGPLVRQLPEGVVHLRTPALQLGGGGRAVGAARLLLRSVLAAARLRPLLRRGAGLVVNTTLALPAAQLASRVAGGGERAWLVHDTLHRADQRLLVRASARGLRAVAVSEATAQPLRVLGLDVVVRYNGVVAPAEPVEVLDVGSATAPGVGGPPVVGCVAQLTHWKGHAVLLDAVAGLPGVHLELAGGMFPTDAAHADALRARAARPDLAGRVRFLGHVDCTAVVPRWDVAVSASTWPEACPLAVLEAMGHGLPVVGTDLGGTPELLAHGGGVLVPAADAAALRGALASLLADPGRRRELGAAGRAAVLERFSLSRTLPEQVDALLERCGQRPRTAAGAARQPAARQPAVRQPTAEPAVVSEREGR